MNFDACRRLPVEAKPADADTQSLRNTSSCFREAAPTETVRPILLTWIWLLAWQLLAPSSIVTGAWPNNSSRRAELSHAVTLGVGHASFISQCSEATPESIWYDSIYAQGPLYSQPVVTSFHYPQPALYVPVNGCLPGGIRSDLTTISLSSGAHPRYATATLWNKRWGSICRSQWTEWRE